MDGKKGRRSRWVSNWPYTPAVAKATRGLYEKVSHVIPEIEWPVFAPASSRSIA